MDDRKNVMSPRPMSGHYAFALDDMKNKYIEARQIEIEESEGKLDKEEYEILTSSFANTIKFKGYVYSLSAVLEDAFIYTNTHTNNGRIEICNIVVSSLTGKYKWEVSEALDYREYTRRIKQIEENINKVKVDLTKGIKEIKDTTATTLTASIEEDTLTLELLNYAGVILSSEELELPVSSKIESITYDAEKEVFIFIYDDGEEIEVSISSLIDSLATKDNLKEVKNELTTLISTLEKKLEDYYTELDTKITGLSDSTIYYEKLATNETQLRALVAQGGVVNLANDIELTDCLEVPSGVITTLELNGHTIFNEKDIWSSSAEKWSLISVNGGSLEISGEGTVKAKEDDAYCVDVKNGGSLTIYGGEYLGNITSIYAYNGFVTIYGGTYSIQQLYSGSATTDPYKYVLNCYDSTFKSGNALFTTYGGSYVNFDPSTPKGPKDDEGNATYEVIVPEGYVVVSEEIGEDTIYSVVEE